MGELFSEFAERFFSLGFYSSDLTFVLCSVVLLGHFDKSWRTWLARLADLAALLVVEAALSFALYAVTRRPGSMPVMFVLLVAYALLQRDIRTTDKIVRCSTFIASFILLTGVTGILIPAMGLSAADSPLGFLPNLASLAGLAAIALFLRRFSVSGFQFVPRGYAYLVVGICLIASVAGWSFIRFQRSYQTLAEDVQSEDDLAVAMALVQDMSAVNLVVDVGFLALTLISYRMFYMLSDEHEQRARRLMTKRVASDNAEMIGVTKSVYESMREVRHETKNRVAYMQALLEDGQYDRLREYFSSFKERTTGLLRYVQSGNTVVDAVVNAKIALATSRGIEVKTMLAVPAELGFAEEDLYVLLANLMDNAIEGAAASDVGEKVIKLSIRPEGGYYIIAVQNPCAHRKDKTGSLGSLKTTKADKEIHGYGTKVISRIARRCNGTARYQVKDDVFTATVMLAQEAGAKGEGD